MNGAAELDLASLNEVERRTLAMLAGGHTAKSIAAEMGVSIHSVNERLREARRKTGAGSSRVLARSLMANGLPAQENRDEQIGLAAGPISGEAKGAPSHRVRRLVGGFVAMIAVLLVGLSAVGHRTPRPAGDPLLAGLLHDAGPSMLQDYARVRSERIDRSWAKGAEATLRTMYGPVSGGPSENLRVTCASSICEVAGTIPDGSDNTVNRLQHVTFDDMTAGKEFGVIAFGIQPGTPRAVFVAYVVKADACGTGANRCLHPAAKGP